MTEILSTDFMQRAILAALLVGAVAPMVGIFVVQRRMSLIGDGMGHVALAGVAIGVLTHRSPGPHRARRGRDRRRRHRDPARAGTHEWRPGARDHLLRGDRRRRRHHQQGPGRHPGNLMKYLFGSILTVRQDDLVIFAVLAVVIAVTTWVLRPRLFAVANDEEYARAVGLPVLTLNIVLAVLTATTVVIAMRIVGLLLISALMIVPNAAAQLFARSFSSGVRWAIALGLVSAVGGVVASYPLNTPSGGTIVLVAIGLFLLISISTSVVQRVRGNRHDRAEGHDHEHGPGCGHASVPHEDHVDYVHDGHLHAPHHGHYDEHGEVAPAEQTTEEVTP